MWNPGRNKLLLAGAPILVLVAAWVAVSPLLADALVVDKPVSHADAIVILSGAADYQQRADGGAGAFLDGIAKMIIVTDDGQRGGWDDTEKGNPYFVERMVCELTARGIPYDAIERFRDNVSGTDDEARQVILAAQERGFTSILIVTSDYHSRRALWTFEREAESKGIPLSIGVLRAPSAAGYPGRWTWWLSVRGWRTVGAEYLKFGYYWLYY